MATETLDTTYANYINVTQGMFNDQQWYITTDASTAPMFNGPTFDSFWIDEPEPEPICNNLGDFLLRKYNKVKEVSC